MKRLGYYPALIFWCLVGAAGLGFCVFLCLGVVKRMGNYKGPDAAYQSSLRQLEQEQKRLESNQRTDKAYLDYFKRWDGQLSGLNEATLRQRIEKIAEENNIVISGVSQLGADRPADEGQGQAPRRYRPSLATKTPGKKTPVPVGGASRGMIEMEVTILGPFSALTKFVAQLESQFGSLKIIKTQWTARSPEEVQVVLGLQCKLPD